ncbi:leucine-rich repeat-containing protein 14B isoform X2 [Pyrgilauda ruficollis]|uniref:leucine-rich repeat-containing protein 14B isoform X2 n=1 Tax=Pyrgilauda ruficollis TaxID=221976 RepID=UPI001B86EF35|nr:leucine-rich repeat-containing protein 14B isoform X2 [Pyrgilauda ruficollis]
MKSLRFISAEAFVSNAEFARKSLGAVAHDLFPLLFKASYLLEQGEVIHDLVENWPLFDFNMGKLLRATLDYEEDLSHRTCSVCLESCLTGLRDYVLNQSSPYMKKLKVVDLTGIKDVEVQFCKCKKTMGRWARTQLLSKLCSDLLVYLQQAQCNPGTFEVSINVLIDLFVTERNYELVVQALLKKCSCPLKICCVAFRFDNLTLQKFFYIIKLADPSLLRKLEIVHNVHLEMEHLEMLFNSIHFPLLMSLTLPARTFNVRRFTATDEQMLTNIGEKMGEMTQFTELSVSFSILTGRIQKLLSGLIFWLSCPLQAWNASEPCYSLGCISPEVLPCAKEPVAARTPNLLHSSLLLLPSSPCVQFKCRSYRHPAHPMKSSSNSVYFQHTWESSGNPLKNKMPHLPCCALTVLEKSPTLKRPT